MDICTVFLIIGAFLLFVAYVLLVRIYIAYRMAQNRHRDPVGWVLLSFLVSPLIAWICLLIMGDENQHPDLERKVEHLVNEPPPTDYTTNS